MKKLSKLLALGLALATAFGMAVSAAGSVTTGNLGTSVKLDSAPEGTIIADIPAENVQAVESDAKSFFRSDDVTIKVVAGFDLHVTNSGNVTLSVAGLKAGAVYAMVHFSSDGVYAEPVEVKVDIEKGTVTFYVEYGSPFVLVEKVPVDKAPENPPAGEENSPAGNQGTGAPAEATAPKTGEAAPVAGMMALVLLAGAVLCAGKARYNR